MGKIFNYIVSSIINLFNKKKMDSKFENDFLTEIQKNINPLNLPSHTKMSLYKNEIINKIEIGFHRSDTTFIVVVFEFGHKQMLVKVGDISGGDSDIVEFKNFFEGVFNLVHSSYHNLFYTYRNSKHWK